jgi:tRNA (cmo5U34)-methyltransferase
LIERGIQTKKLDQIGPKPRMKLPVEPAAPPRPATTERWADSAKTYGHSNPNRAREVAKRIIAFGIKSVLDIGCGDMKLGELMKEAGIAYHPADVVSRCPACLVVDLNKDEVPRCDAECAVMIGVTEFLEDPLRVLKDISGKYRRILMTLSPAQTIYEQVWHGKPHTIVVGDHVVAFALDEFKRLFAEHFVLEDIDVLSTGQYILLGRSKSEAFSASPRRAVVSSNETNPQPGVEDNVIDFSRLADGFEAHIFKSVPFHSMFLRTTALLASTVVWPGTVCVDIGCSTGRLPRLLRRRFAGVVPVEILAIDNSPEMIAQARSRDSSLHTKYICEDISSYELPRSAVFVSCLFTLQFLDLEARKAILEKIYKALDWRGSAVVAEKVLEQDGKKQMVNHYLLNAYKHSMELSDEEVMTKERAVRSVLRPLSREQNLQLFESAGFKDSQVILSAFGWELYLLRKT